MAKTNSGLIEYAKAQLGLPYWYGTFGQTATESLYTSKKKQYPTYYTANDFSSQYGKRVHDCVGLIKGYIWSTSTTATPTYNSAQDKSAAGMYSASTLKGDMSTFDGVAGRLLYKGTTVSGIHHVGVYGGDGYVYEAKGHAYGVIKTTYVKSDWNYWSQCPYITADTTTSSTTTSTTSTSGNTTATTTTSTYNKTEQWKGVVTASSMNVRKAAGAENELCSFSPLTKGTVVSVCDSTKAASGVTWYYILYNGKYGFASSSYIEKQTETTTTTASTSSTVTSTKTATDKAKSYDKSLKGTYKSTAKLNVRNGAGTSKSIMVTIPKGTEVINYGYYTVVGTSKWLYVQFTYNNVKYTGFCSKNYLTK